MIDHKGVENGVRERYGVKGEGERSQRETEGKKESEKRMRKCVKEKERVQDTVWIGGREECVSVYYRKRKESE